MQEDVDLEMNATPFVDGSAGTAAPLKTLERPRDEELRIIIFTACYFVLDGVTLTIRKLESHLRSRGATVVVCTTVPDDFDMDDQADSVIVVPGVKLAFTQAGSGYAFGANLLPDVVRQIEEFKPNCCHFTVPDFVSLDAIRWCQENNVAYMATWHSNYLDYLKYYYLETLLGGPFKLYLQSFYDQIPSVYAPTPFMLSKLKGMGFGGENSVTEYKEWGRGVDTKLFSPDRRSSEFRTSRGMSDDDVLIIWVGRIVPEKRPDIWTDIVTRLNDEGIPCKGVVVGHGFSQNELAKLPNIHCLGWLSGVGLAEAYASADILVFPSDVETFGSVTLEALSSGCVCVVESGCSGHLVESGFNGYTCTAGAAEEFYEATKTLVSNHELRREMSINARRSAWKYERNKILQQMAENYKDAIVNHKDPKYIRDMIADHPEVAGKNFLSTLCCNYFIIKRVLEPFLDTTSKFQDVMNWFSSSTKEASIRKCLPQCTCSCCGSLPLTVCCKSFSKEKSYGEVSSDEECDDDSPTQVGHRRSRSMPLSLVFLIRAMNFFAIAASYIIIALFVYASFTV